MELIATADNPVPPGATVTAVPTKDGMLLRAARWPATGPSRGTVVVLPGRAEFIEAFLEPIGELIARQFEVVALDWRGQGLSQRQLRDPRKGHIDDFDLYQLDLEALKEHVLERYCAKPFFALGHSMGAAVLLAQARAGRSPFARLVLTSPMIALAELRFKSALHFTVEALDILGFGGAYIPGGGSKPFFFQPLSETNLTSDKDRYARMTPVLRAAPDLGVGDPTIGWTHAAFRLMKQFEDADFPRRTYTPTLVIAAGYDTLIATDAIEAFASRLKAGRFITLPYARHEILMERDVFRAQFWAAFDSFIPGVHDRVAQAVDEAMAIKPQRRRRFFPWPKIWPKIRAPAG
ncbi:MAG: alpha/beta hydrolase [Methylovirgula sp.]|jgi:lysophospholipase